MKIKVLVFVLILGSVFVAFRLSAVDKQAQQSVLIDVLPGETFYQLASQLEQKQLIRSARDFKLLVYLLGRPHIKQGEYELSADMSPLKIFQILKKGEEHVFKISFPEGFNHYQMAELLKSHNYAYSDQFLKKVWDFDLIEELLGENRNSLEGYLFPSTYYLKKYLPVKTLIQNMTQNFFKAFKEIQKVKLKFALTDHQIVTFASLIEKETGLSKERPLIAGVFFNRLNKKMKLQTDPTILYSLYLLKGFDIKKNIRKKDILMSSPYNTYVVYGLPPGPIANPGQDSLKAVFYPELSEYLYFVSKNDGSHYFSTNYKEHKTAVYKYQIQKK